MKQASLTKPTSLARLISVWAGIVLLLALPALWPHPGRLVAQGTADDETRLDNPVFEFDGGRQVLFVRFDVSNGQPIDAYRVTIINKDNIRVGQEVAGVGFAPPVIVPFDNYDEGEYTVRIQALDTSGASLAVVEDQFRHTPPAAPGRMATLLNILGNNLALPIAIGLIVLVVVVFLVISSRRDRRATGTPFLQDYGLVARDEVDSALEHTGLYRPAAATEQGPTHVMVKITAYPDRKRVGEKYKVTRFPYTMGRGDCHLNLADDTSVSRLHAQIRLEGGRLGIVDLMSSNGTFVDGQRIPAEHLVELSDKKTTSIRLGSHTQITLKSGR